MLTGCTTSLQLSHDEALPFLEAVGVKYEGVGFTFQKPASVTVGGSYPLHLVAKPEQNVDVIVEIPKVCHTSPALIRKLSCALHNLIYVTAP